MRERASPYVIGTAVSYYIIKAGRQSPPAKYSPGFDSSQSFEQDGTNELLIYSVLIKGSS